jgi:hypothetical protein
LLEASNPSPGQTRYHDRRFEHQQQGASTFLIAWAEGDPAGHGEILWTGCAAPEVRGPLRWAVGLLGFGPR